ncbi:iron-siderophore ABC transporter substrate-binding protein [Roseibium aggregatum]|uniref:Iron-siderophore ABC transporter substrate-binding protein n=1 Tax=Roseibium aggregatum TaxID=187304 RepID=A0A939EBK0_9HYPH|nr:iron-siderophore ABC transporter substrate-binding protein [Roseibium aggregatum]MBN9668890.1 iron-siderophore ABC transporter substrate-binding protein [Roseibium aggregatum]
MRLTGLFICFTLCFPPALAACEGETVAEGIYGDPVCVPSSPKRIVTLEPWLSLGTLVELDAPVVGVPVMGIQDQGLRDHAEAASMGDVGHPMQPSLERIIALQPDLIVGSTYIHGQIHEKLSQVAPTLLLDQMGWKEHYLLLARISGRLKQAREKLGDFERRAGAISDRVPDGLKVSAVRVARQGFQVYLDGPGAYAPYQVLREAGVQRTDYETTLESTMVKRPDWEEISALDGDILLYVVAAGMDTADDEQLATSTAGNPLWQTLPAVKAGRAHRVDRTTWMAFHGLASAHRVLDDVERYILDAPSAGEERSPRQ